MIKEAAQDNTCIHTTRKHESLTCQSVLVRFLTRNYLNKRKVVYPAIIISNSGVEISEYMKINWTHYNR
jgi:hypothetical protein